MTIETIIAIVTVIVTYGLGMLSKRSKFIKNNLIPVQNLLIGVTAFIIDYIITKDINIALAGAGLFTGGAYDLLSNFKRIQLTDAMNEELSNGTEVDE